MAIAYTSFGSDEATNALPSRWRSTFASHFMMNGGNIYDLQKIMGHTSLEMTQRYAHLAPEHLVHASNVVSFGAKKLSEKKIF